MTIEDMFSGKSIYGDGFDQSQINHWFEQEETGYSDLGYVDGETDYYPYHEMNRRYGWKYVDQNISRVLGLGSAFGSEFSMIAERVDSITIIEPDRKFWRPVAFGKALNYVVPKSSGEIEFEASAFDLVTAFGVLHHIPNVSYVFSELIRVLRPGGLLLVREPIISMGDWRAPRQGLTINERGLPLEVVRSLIQNSDCELVKESLLMFSPLQKLASMLGIKSHWHLSALIAIDGLLCSIFSFNYKYHRVTALDKFSPASAFWVIRKK